MTRPNPRHEPHADHPTRTAPPVVVSLGLALAVPAVVLVALLPTAATAAAGAAFTAGTALGFAAARR
ncbi:hypothetical protein [Halocalculus aciditolerans]|uniref:Uncharacterized protein n=1 Tax=Halocalculus aciditolerans TaxID=1383812 RepID=A0A830F3H3_9EURY|nr:hypothetical protein [Halocalculus aciditolerans]GGL58957.1 hypothetical protein GCM10009039_16490 [Halocalculus aciditolerans]